MKKKKIQLHTANALLYLGSLYRNPADAIKEHISNAVDEHVKAGRYNRALPACKVILTLEKDIVLIEYPYGMSKQEFEEALDRVADSVKKNIKDVRQIGQLGIGMFSFLQVGKKCTFVSKKDIDDNAFKVILREGVEDAEFSAAKKRESPIEAGMRIEISQLKFNPTKPRGPLSPGRLEKVFAEKFDPYLRNGSLEILIRAKGKTHRVRPLEIDLPPIAAEFKELSLSRDPGKRLSLDLYFDPSGNGAVAIRHSGVTIVENISQISAYGLEESVLGSGYVKGFIDADFLEPLPARSGFSENNDWIGFLDELDKLCPMIEEEVSKLRRLEQEKKLTEIQRKAIQLAKDILESEEMKDLELLEGLGRKEREYQFPPDGFAFMPSSIRVPVGCKGSISLKAMVPSKVPDNSIVNFSITNDRVLELKTGAGMLRASSADEHGVVAIRLEFLAKAESTIPVILIAETGPMRAEARIRIAEKEQERVPITGKEKTGSGINYEEIAFEDGPAKHSRYVARVIQINTLNPDYKREMSGSDEAKLAYATLMIGKETIAFNDKSGAVDEYLEKMLTFYFKLKDRISGSSTGAIKRARGRPRKIV